jgi:hypothetical protein
LVLVAPQVQLLALVVLVALLYQLLLCKPLVVLGVVLEAVVLVVVHLLLAALLEDLVVVAVQGQSVL